MGFFDNVLEEQATGTTSSVAKDEQDGSFLIIDDNMNANSLPDTAVQLFDATPKTEAVPVAEASIFSDSTTSVVEDSEVLSEKENIPSSEISFFDSPVSDTEITTLVASVEEDVIELPKEVVTTAVVEEITEPVQEAVILDIAPSVEITKEQTVSLEKNDIYAPLRKAINEYDTILASHAQIADVKDREITEYETQIVQAKEVEKQTIEAAKKLAKEAIDKAKASSKIALEEREALTVEMDRVNQMKGIFSAQLV